MKLPNAHDAIIPIEKVRDYLLSADHPVGASKARWFSALGYRREQSEKLIGDLRSLVTDDAESLGDEGFGEKFSITASLISPSATRYTVRTIWIMRPGETVPRFVTAYPGGE